MNLSKSAALGSTMLLTSLMAQSALASSSIQVLGDDTREVRVIIERIDGDGGTTVREIIGGGYTIHDRTEDGRLVRVELTEDDEDGTARTRVCIIDDGNDIECSGEPLRTHRLYRDHLRADILGGSGLHIERLRNLHRDRSHDRNSGENLARLDAEMDELREELQDLQQRLDELNRREN